MSGMADGDGISGFPSGSSVPMPSGGFMPSVHNKSIDMVTNDVPSRLVLPSSHNDVNIQDNKENSLRLNDFVFVLRDLNYKFSPSFQSRRMYHMGSFADQEIPIATIQMVNQLLRSCARQGYQAGIKDGSFIERWWESPQLVAEWCRPYGAVLNMMQMSSLGGGGGRQGKDRMAVNVVVSRRANVKNNFFSVTEGANSGEKWHAQSMNQVVVQYSLERVTLQENVTVDVVVLSMLVVDDPITDLTRATGRETPLTFDFKSGDQSTFMTCIPTETHDAFVQTPLRQTEKRVLVPIGRVLHSPPRSVKGFEALSSYFNKDMYDNLRPVEIELGCH